MTAATLRIVHRHANLREVSLCPVTLVGRSVDCQLRIASQEVSRRHCQLVLRPDGVYLEDLGSSNGTFLDGIRVPPNTPTYAHPGATLSVGPARFVVEYAGDRSSRAAGPETLPLVSDKEATVAIPAAESKALQFDEPNPPAAAPPVKRSFLNLFRRTAATPTPANAAAEAPVEVTVAECHEPQPSDDESFHQFLKQL